MKRVYLDQEQCERFNVPYMFSDGRLEISAKDLLASKGNGYDKKHHDYLSRFGASVITLVRTNKVDCPGWFRVIVNNP